MVQGRQWWWHVTYPAQDGMIEHELIMAVAVAQSAANISDAEPEGLQRTLRRMDRARTRNRSWTTLNTSFHDTAYAASRLPRLIEMIRVQRTNVDRVRPRQGGRAWCRGAATGALGPAGRAGRAACGGCRGCHRTTLGTHCRNAGAFRWP